MLPGVPERYVRERMAAAGGNELESGKFASPESSAALAANCFGWFNERPHLLPSFPSMDEHSWTPQSVEIEICARFPWSGGKHPWLDSCVLTNDTLIGVESKRFEPFRDRKNQQAGAKHACFERRARFPSAWMQSRLRPVTLWQLVSRLNGACSSPCRAGSMPLPQVPCSAVCGFAPIPRVPDATIPDFFQKDESSSLSSNL
jgi:hypothetical protein